MLSRSRRSHRLLAVGLTLAVLVGLPATTLATHSWGNYHWARTANPFTIQLGNNVSGAWGSVLATASTDWSVSSVLDTTIVPGATRPKTCKATTGRVEVCNAAYGNNGWLGVAQIWVSGSHITQATVKVNDTYFKTSTYNTTAWRNLVMCQEIGHTFGLDHQDENFNNNNLGTCMDYTNDPSTNQHPNAHDYAQLESIYSHLDSTTTIGQTTTNKPPRGRGWGQMISNEGRNAVFVNDLGNGQRIFTFVIWAR